MAKAIRNHLRSNVVGYVAIFLVLTMSTAYATHGAPDSISSEDIINGQVKTNDVGNNQIRTADVRDDTLADGGLAAVDLDPASVTSSELATNAILADGIGSEGSSKMANFSVGANELKGDSVRSNSVLNDSLTGNDVSALTGTDITDESVTGADIDDGSVGAADLSGAALGGRAFGRVGEDGTLSRSKNIDSVSHPTDGKYCIDPAPAIDISTAVLLVAPEGSENHTDFDSHHYVEWDAGGGGGFACPGTTFTVLSALHTPDAVVQQDGSFAFTIP